MATKKSPLNKINCDKSASVVESIEDGNVSSVVSLQPVKEKPNWRRLVADWHLDKRVPVSLIGAILLQSMAAIWWASSVEAKTGELNKRTDHIAEYIARQADGDQKIRETLARLDERVKQQTEILADINRKTNK